MIQEGWYQRNSSPQKIKCAENLLTLRSSLHKTLIDGLELCELLNERIIHASLSNMCMCVWHFSIHETPRNQF